MSEKKAADESKETLPFSFKKKEISEAKIATHWQKIAARLSKNEDDPETGSDEKIKQP